MMYPYCRICRNRGKTERAGPEKFLGKAARFPGGWVSVQPQLEQPQLEVEPLLEQPQPQPQLELELLQLEQPQPQLEPLQVGIQQYQLEQPEQPHPHPQEGSSQVTEFRSS